MAHPLLLSLPTRSAQQRNAPFGPRVAAFRRNSRETVEAFRPKRWPISRIEWPCTFRRVISSRSANERLRPERGLAEDLNIAGGVPPAFRNNVLPTGCDNLASSAAWSVLCGNRLPKSCSAPCVPPHTAGQAMTIALVLTVANVDLQRSSRPATSGVATTF